MMLYHVTALQVLQCVARVEGNVLVAAAVHSSSTAAPAATCPESAGSGSYGLLTAASRFC